MLDLDQGCFSLGKHRGHILGMDDLVAFQMQWEQNPDSTRLSNIPSFAQIAQFFVLFCDEVAKSPEYVTEEGDLVRFPSVPAKACYFARRFFRVIRDLVHSQCTHYPDYVYPALMFWTLSYTCREKSVQEVIYALIEAGQNVVWILGDPNHPFEVFLREKYKLPLEEASCSLFDLKRDNIHAVTADANPCPTLEEILTLLEEEFAHLNIEAAVL